MSLMAKQFGNRHDSTNIDSQSKDTDLILTFCIALSNFEFLTKHGQVPLSVIEIFEVRGSQ